MQSRSLEQGIELGKCHGVGLADEGLQESVEFRPHVNLAGALEHYARDRASTRRRVAHREPIADG